MIRTTGKTEYITLTPQELSDAVQNWLMIQGEHKPNTLATPVRFTPLGGLTLEISPSQLPPSEKIIPFQPLK